MWPLTPLTAQVVNAMDAMGNAVFSDGVSLVFTLTITNLANSKAGLAVASVRGRPYLLSCCAPGSSQTTSTSM